MKLRLSILLLAAAALAASPAAGQTVKSLGYNTTNGRVVYSSSNALTFTNSSVVFSNIQLGIFGTGSDTGFVGRNSGGLFSLYGTNVSTSVPAFYGWSGIANTAFSAGTARTNLGLGGSDSVTFSNLSLSANGSLSIGGMNLTAIDSGIDLAFKRTGSTELELKTNGLILHVGSYAFSGSNTNGASTTRNNLGLGATSAPTFSNINLAIFGSGSSGGFAGRNSGGLFEIYGTNVSTSVPAFYGWSGSANTAFSAGTARTNLELGATNAVTFSNITASGTLSVSNTATFATNVTVSGNATLNGSDNLAPQQAASSGSSLMTRGLSDARYSFSRWYGAGDLLYLANTATVITDISRGTDTGFSPIGNIMLGVSDTTTKFNLPVDWRVAGTVKVVSYWSDRVLTNSGGTNADIAVWSTPNKYDTISNTQTNGLAAGTIIKNTFTANYGGTSSARFYVVEQTVDLGTVSGISATNPMQIKTIEVQRRASDATDTSTNTIYLSGVHIYVP